MKALCPDCTYAGHELISRCKAHEPAGVIRSVIVYGPQGVGKTRHKDWLAAKYGARCIQDGWAPGQPIRDHALVLTNATREQIGNAPVAVIVPYKVAIKGGV